MALPSAGLPMPLVAVSWHNWLSKKKTEGTQGIAATAKVPGGPSRSSQKINEGKNKRVVAAPIAKEPGSLKLRSGADVLQLRHYEQKQRRRLA